MAGETGLEPATDGFGVRAKRYYKFLYIPIDVDTVGF